MVMKERLFIVNAIILIVLALGGCCSKPVVEPLFKDAAIQDSLQCFLERIDSVPNHYNAPSLYAVRFNLKGQDSLIRFGAYTGLWMYEVDTIGFDTRTPNWIGLYRYGNKFVLVESRASTMILPLGMMTPFITRIAKKRIFTRVQTTFTLSADALVDPILTSRIGPRQ